MQTAAPTDLKTQLTSLISEAITTALPEASHIAIELDRPKQAAHGDYACNIALQAAKLLRKNPRDVAQQLLQALPTSPVIEKAEIAGAGFINFFLSPAAKQQTIKTIFAAGKNYGRIDLGKSEKIL